MNENYRKINTRFGPDIGFDVRTVPFRVTQISNLEALKERLLRQALGSVTGPEQNSALRRAANDAAALAWATGHPLLFYPVLFEEKAPAELRQNHRQREIRRRSFNLVAEAA